MKNKVLAIITAFIMISLISANGEEISSKTIQDYINNGWSEEFAKIDVPKEKIYDYEIDMLCKFSLIDNESIAKIDENANITLYDYSCIITRLSKDTTTDINKLIESENIVLCKDAIKDIVTLLGFDIECNYTNKSFRAIAMKYKLLDGITLEDDKPISIGQMAKLVYNSLNVDMMSVSISTDIKYNVEKGNTLLKQMNIEIIKGIVSAVDDINLYGLKEIGNNHITIDRNDFKTAEIDCHLFLGHYVTAYYTTDDNTKTLIKIGINNKDNFVKLNYDNIAEISDSAISYYLTDKLGEKKEIQKKLAVNSAAPVTYNGSFVGTMNSVENEILSIGNGYISLNDIDSDGKYDIVIIEKYNIFIAQQSTENKIVLKDGKGTIDLVNKDKVKIYLDGNEIKTSEISEYNVLSVATNKDDTKCIIYVSSEMVMSNIIEYNENFITLEQGKRFKYQKDLIEKLDIESTYNFYLTFDGKIAYAKIEDVGFTTAGTGRNYGYLRACDYKELEDEIDFRIFCISSGTWKTYKGSERITFYDGAEMVDNGMTGIIPQGKPITHKQCANKLKEPQLIVFKTDVKGVLISITTAKDLSISGITDDDVFAFNRNFSTSVRTYYGGYFGGIYQAGKTIVLEIPNDRTQEKYYKFSKIPNDSSLLAPFDIYDVDSSLCLNGIILKYVTVGARVLGDNTKNIAVSDIKQAIDSNGEQVYRLYNIDGKFYDVNDFDENIGLESVLNKTLKKTYNVKKITDIKIGDIGKIELDSFGKITAFRIDFRLSEVEDTNYFSYVAGDLPATLSYDYGVVIKNPKSEHILINSTKDGTEYKNNVPRIPGNIVAEFDTNTGKLKILSNKYDILQNDKIFMSAVYYYNNTMAIVIK